MPLKYIEKSTFQQLSFESCVAQQTPRTGSMENLQAYLIRRKAELNAEMERLRAELRQIAAAEHAAASVSRRKFETVSKPPETIKEQVIKILRDEPKGLTAQDILHHLRRRFERNVKRESLSPQLSRLAAEGTLERKGKNWTLPITNSGLDRLRQHIEARSEKFELVPIPYKSAGSDTENPQGAILRATGSGDG